MVRSLFFIAAACATLSLGCDQPNEDSGESADSSAHAAGESNGSTQGNWGDRFNRSVSDSRQWLTDMYESAKKSGTTTATSVKDWVADDWKAQGDWQYQLFHFESGSDEDLVLALNALGEQRWECFHVDVRPDGRTFYMKRTRRSYLKNLPLRDVMEFLPAGGEGQ